MRWDLVRAIKHRLEHPEEIPGKSWYTVYREDIQMLLKLIEENENERREETIRIKETYQRRT